VNVPRDLHDRTLAVDRAARELESALGHHPTVAELAEHLDLEDEDVLETLHATQARRADSLATPPTAMTMPRRRARPSRTTTMASPRRAAR
jgi:RNA polymerase sigma-B factor